MITSFSPLVHKNTKILILGSIPGIASLKKLEYYAHPRNNFWRIIYTFFKEECIPTLFEDKITFLLSKNMGLWDVLGSCERKGSLDVNIKNQIVNDFEALFIKYKNIDTLIFNGKESYRFFYKKYGQIKGITYHVMPSTSPANTMSFENKLNLWSTSLK
ncbi:MAG: hypoxanthine-DNA glycosylase [Flavobacteriales bacterium]|jgi:hypoxanthine-DNA glycosylase